MRMESAPTFEDSITGCGQEFGAASQSSASGCKSQL